MKTQRREVRLSPHEDDLIVEAAGLSGVSVSEFLLDRAVADAQETVDAHHTIRLDSEAHRKFLAALDSPSAPPAELVDQIRKSRPLKHVD